MLNSASDYQFLNVSGLGSYIHGNVLPVRFNASSSSGKKATCTYEDYLYLLEAYYERINYDAVGLNNITPASRVLLASAYNATRPNFPTGLFISNQLQLPSTTTLTQMNSNGWNLNDLLGNTTVSLSSLAYTTSKSTLQLELLGRRFYDYHKLTRIQTTPHLDFLIDGNISYQYTTYYNDGTSNVDASGTINPSGNYAFYAYNFSRGGSGSRLTERLLANSFTPKTSTTQYPNASGAWLIAKMTSDAGSTSRYHAYIRPLTVTNTGGNATITIPNNVISDACQKVCAARNRPYYTSAPLTFDNTANDTITIQFGFGYLVIDFNFPADYSSWNWSPTP